MRLILSCRDHRFETKPRVSEKRDLTQIVFYHTQAEDGRLELLRGRYKVVRHVGVQSRQSKPCFRERFDVFGRADSHDPIAADGYGIGDRPFIIDCNDIAVDQYEIGGVFGAGWRAAEGYRGEDDGVTWDP